MMNKHNIGSREKLSPCEYTVLYPGKTRLFLPASLAENENPGTTSALPGLIGGSIPALKPCYVPAIRGPLGAGVSNDWCITKVWHCQSVSKFAILRVDED